MDAKRMRGLYVTGGVCAILWPLLSELFFFAATAAVGRAMASTDVTGPGRYAVRLYELGQHPATLPLEWSRVGFQLLLWPFLLAMGSMLVGCGQRNLAWVGAGLGVLGMAIMMMSHTLYPTFAHSLAQTYVTADEAGAGAAILAVLSSLMNWHRGLNQVSCLLYQGCVTLLSLALIRGRIWKVRGWIGLVGAVLALPAKLPLGWRVPSNILWTGLAYAVWPVATGIGLLREPTGE